MMKYYPKISIITTTFNSEKTLEQTVSSIVEQTYNNIEYIIIDGKSTDKTINIIKKYESYISYWCSEPDKGIYDAMMKGVNIASGDYLIFIGSDDCLTDRNIIKKMVDELDDNVDLISCSVWDVDEKTKMMREITNYHARNRDKFSGGMIPHQGMVVKRKLMNKYKFDLRYSIAADYKFFLQCYYDQAVHIKFSDIILSFYSMSGVSSLQREKLKYENDRIHEELNLTFKQQEKKCLIIVIYILEKIHVFPFLRKVKYHCQWRKHQCTNKICRWCNRAR